MWRAREMAVVIEEERIEEEEDRDDEGKTTAKAVKRTLWEKND